VQANTSSVATQSAAFTAITAVGSALNTVANERATLGAYESRFNFSDAVAQSSLFGTQVSLSVLLDADSASEKAQLSAQIVQTQAAIAAAAQASLLPVEMLKLIETPAA
jgi:flagellin